MTITIINNCRDANAVGRQSTRAASLLGAPVSFIGVASDLEASGNLIDTLDATKGQRGVVLVNVAPRNGKSKKWGNGTPFCYFWYKETLVVATLDDFTLSLVKKLKLTDNVNILDVKELVPEAADSQFRSYEFLPQVAVLLMNGKNGKSTLYSIDKIPDVPQAIWWVDNFGNCKTTILAEELENGLEKEMMLKMGKLNHFPRLKDVPDGAAALVTGSSGIDTRRFVEIVVQGGNAAEHFHLASGDRIT